MHPRINNIMTKIGVPTNDDDWFYVSVKPLKVNSKTGVPPHYTVNPIVEWLREQGYYYWEFKWYKDKEFTHWIKKSSTLYQDRHVCFRFSNEDHALHFKLVWG